MNGKQPYRAAYQVLRKWLVDQYPLVWEEYKRHKEFLVQMKEFAQRMEDERDSRPKLEVSS